MFEKQGRYRLDDMDKDDLLDLAYNYEYAEKNIRKAIKLYQLAADKGSDFAQLRMGEFYEEGKGVLKNLYKAMEFYKSSSRKGNDIATEKLKSKEFLSKFPDPSIFPQNGIIFFPHRNACQKEKLFSYRENAKKMSL